MSEALAPPVDDAVLFEAVIVPHRSLSRRGLALVIAAICAASFLTALIFWLLGAWPVAGFSGAEVTLAVVLMRAHAHVAHESEMVLLSARGLRVIRTDRRGARRERALDPSWLRVELLERAGRVPALLLTGGRVREEIAVRLGEAEKRDLAAALAEALHAWRHPRFDNPQLREE
jgi:uncharacterized membrane protein